MVVIQITFTNFAFMDSIYKEELTTAMHSEFFVSEEIDRKHKCFSALGSMAKYGMSIQHVTSVYGVSKSEIEKHRKEYELLFTE
jgi:hypothetical protein